MANLTSSTYDSDDEDEEVFVIPMPEGDYEEAICAIVPLEDGLAILDASEDEEEGEDE